MKKMLFIGVILLVLAAGFIYMQDVPSKNASGDNMGSSGVFQLEGDEIPAFLEFVGKRGWYSHKIVSVDNNTETLVVRDGIGHEFTLDFGFAEMHLKDHHGVASYIDDMGIYGFLVFAMENNLYQHEVGPIDIEAKRVLVYGDKDTEFATEFYMTFENIIKHMQNDHKWTNHELLEAGYCQEAFRDDKVDVCVKKLEG